MFPNGNTGAEKFNNKDVTFRNKYDFYGYGL